MPKICDTVVPNEIERLRDFMQRRRNEIQELCKTSSSTWRKDAFERLKNEFRRLRGPMKEASVGGTLEYAYVLERIVECCSTQYGSLTPKLVRGRMEIRGSIGYDLRVFKRKREVLSYTERELRVLECLEGEVLRLRKELQPNRPA